MPTPSQKTLLSQVRGKLITRYGSVNAACREFGVTRMGIRLALLGKCPGIREKLVAAGILTDDVAANSAQGLEPGIVVCASNARPLSGGEWEQITPWGNFPNPAGLQRLNKRTGQAMVDAFNSVMARAKRAISPVPVYAGHPDVDPKRWPDDRRLGKLEALEARDDGLWCKPAFNDLGRKNKEEGYWVYPSGVWKYRSVGGGVIEPTELLSVGLTNVPVIKEVSPWTKNAQDKAANAGPSAGALKGWETRRRNGTIGRNNPRAVKALSTLRARSAGRKPTAEDKAAAADELETRAKVAHAGPAVGGDRDRQVAAQKAGVHERDGKGRAVWRKETQGSRGYTSAGGGYKVAAEGARFKSGAYEMKKMPSTGRHLLTHQGKVIGNGTKTQLYKQAELHEARQKSDQRAAAVFSGPLETAQARLDASRSASAAATPPPLPAHSASSSSGPGTHIHIHAGSGSESESPRKPRGLIASILDAFARPHVHDGGAINSGPSNIALEHYLGIGAGQREASDSAAMNAEHKTPSEAKREAKAAGEDHQDHLDALSAGTFLATKQKELMQKEGIGEQMAWHRARYLHPKEAAAWDNHHAEQRESREKADKLKKKEQLQKAKAFASRVHARMDREKIEYPEAWARQKKEEGIQ